MALTLSKIDANPVSKMYTAVGTQDASVAAQSVYCGFTPKVITLIRTDSAGNDYFAVNTSTPGATTSLTAVTKQYVNSTGVTTIVASNGITPLSGQEATPAAAAAGQPANPTASGGFTIGTGALTASSTIYIIAEG